MGLSLHNAFAVLEGLFGRKTPFIRTPKFNVTDHKKRWKGNIYIKNHINLMTVMEGVLSIYFIFGVAFGIHLQDFGLILFHLMLAAGFGSVFYYSVRPAFYE